MERYDETRNGRWSSSAIGRVVRTGSEATTRRIQSMFSARGEGFRHLAESHAAAVAGDTAVAVALAGTLFFQVPSSEARGNVALYLLLTIAPFAVLGPVLGQIFARFPASYRTGLAVSSGVRAVLAVAMMIAGLRSWWLYPLAFLLLVFSRLHGISRSALLPGVLSAPVELVSANARLARIGVLAGALTAVVAAPALTLMPSWPALMLAAVLFVVSSSSALRLPPIAELVEPVASPKLFRLGIPRAVKLARLATVGVRLLNGFLLLLVAFAFRDVDAGFLDFSALLAAAGFGFLLAAMISPFLERKLREEPMVVAALAIEAAAAFTAAQIFGLPAAAALAAAAGLAWGTAKFAFDGLLQSTVEANDRGVAFTESETLFQLSWVVGALIPTAVAIPAGLGLAVAGMTALAVQLVYISSLLVTVGEMRKREADTGPIGSSASERPASGPPAPGTDAASGGW